MISKENLQKWTDALRSGKYDQTEGELQNRTGYCCLGVACKLFIESGDIIHNNQMCIHGGSPIDQPEAPRWLVNIDKDFKKQTGISLSDLNDHEKLSFAEIADELERVYGQE